MHELEIAVFGSKGHSLYRQVTRFSVRENRNSTEKIVILPNNPIIPHHSYLHRRWYIVPQRGNHCDNNYRLILCEEFQGMKYKKFPSISKYTHKSIFLLNLRNFQALANIQTNHFFLNLRNFQALPNMQQIAIFLKLFFMKFLAFEAIFDRHNFSIQNFKVFPAIFNVGYFSQFI